MKHLQSYVSIFALCLLTLLSVGCGSDNQDVTVATGGSPTASVGNLSFAFAQVNPQTAGEVPNTTTVLRFDFFRTNPPSVASLVGTEIRPYAENIIIEAVPEDVILVTVTALDGNNFPLVTLQGNATVILGETTPVDLGSAEVVALDTLTVTPDPAIASKEDEPKTTQLIFSVGFSNGATFVIPSFDATNASFSQPQGEVADISATGVVSTNVGGESTTAQASFTFGNSTVTDDFQIDTYCIEIQEFNNVIDLFFFGMFPGDRIPGDRIIAGQQMEQIGVPSVFFATFTGPDGQEIRLVNIGEIFSVDENVSFALANDVTGVNINSENGFLSFGEAVQPGFITVVMSYDDPVSGLTFTRSVEIELVEFEGEGE